MSHVKGSNLLSRMQFVIDRFGPEAWEKVLNALPNGEGARLSPRILPSSWYPFTLYNHLDMAICQVLAGGKLGICQEMGADSARRALAGTYRIYLKDGPAALLRRLAVLHRTFYDAGKMEVTSLDDGHSVIRNSYVPCSTRTNCLVAAGFYATVVELCGGRNVRVTEGNCSAEGARDCLFNILWETGPQPQIDRPRILAAHPTARSRA
ncbi:MAG: hypothetical protein ACE5ID_00290 [Acidobacteriota bacterium]